MKIDIAFTQFCSTVTTFTHLLRFTPYTIPVHNTLLAFVFYFLVHSNFNLLKAVTRCIGVCNAMFKTCTDKGGII